VAIVWMFRAVPGPQTPKEPQAPSLSKLGLAAPAAAALALLVAFTAVPAEVAPAGSSIVYLIPDPEGKPNQQSVLATPALLNQLDNLAKRGAAGLHGARWRGPVRGLEPGALVVTTGGLKVKNGTPLIINNKIEPKDDANPHPQEH